MDRRINHISQLTKNRSNWTILVRITRLSLGIRPKITAENANLDVVAIDEKGDHIHIEIENEDVPRYKGLLKEGNIYLISKFAVKTTGMFKPVSRELKIVFTSTTEVEHIKDPNSQIPHHKFEFADYQIIFDATKRDNQLFDLIGVYVGSSRQVRDTAHGRSNVTYVTLQDLNGKQCVVMLWEDLSDKFNSMSMEKHEGTKILIITSLLVRTFIAPSCGSSTSGTKVYLNLDYPEVNEYMARYAGENIEPVMMPLKAQNRKLDLDGMEKVTKTIKELLELPRNKLKENTLYVCSGKISDFDLDRDWYYIACEVCKKKMFRSQHKDNTFPSKDRLYCRSCAQETAPIPWYKIEAEVEDHRGKALFVHLGRAGDELLNMPITNLLNLEECDKRLLCTPLSDLLGTTHKFGVVVNSQSLSAPKLNFKVLKVFDEEKSQLATPSIQTPRRRETSSRSAANLQKRTNQQVQDEDPYPSEEELLSLEKIRKTQGIVIKEGKSKQKKSSLQDKMTGAAGKKLKQIAEIYDGQTLMKEELDDSVDAKKIRERSKKTIVDMDSFVETQTIADDPLEKRLPQIKRKANTDNDNVPLARLLPSPKQQKRASRNKVIGKAKQSNKE